jgi:phospholipase D1/2
LIRDSSILIPGVTVWKKNRAPRMTLLHDAADYFSALRQSLLRAEMEVHIVGWDIHSETPLVGASGNAEDGLPLSLAPFLKALLHLKPKLKINILIW